MEWWVTPRHEADRASVRDEVCAAHVPGNGEGQEIVVEVTESPREILLAVPVRHGLLLPGRVPASVDGRAGGGERQVRDQRDCAPSRDAA